MKEFIPELKKKNVHQDEMKLDDMTDIDESQTVHSRKTKGYNQSYIPYNFYY
jgi:hypothetical protein